MDVIISADLRPELTLWMAEEEPLETASAAVRACAVGNGLGVERATRLQVVVEELLREARGREKVGTDGEIRVGVVVDGSSIRVAISDARLPLTAAEARHLPSRRLLSLGFVDGLHVAYLGADGNRATCEMRLGAPERERVGDEILGEDGPDAPAGLGDDLVIRLMEESDIVGLIRCIFRCYGYTYPDLSFYEERSIRRLLRSGLLRSVVASTSEGEIIGHCALVLDGPDDAVPEAGKMIVDPRFRGHHLAERMAQVRNDVALGLGLAGVYCDCVTNHVGSQRAALQRDAVEVGLLIGITPASLTMAGLPNPDGGRRSLLAMYNTCVPVLGAEISLPSHLVEVVGPIADELGIARSISAVVVEPSAANSVHQVVVQPWTDGTAMLTVEKVGRDLVDRLTDDLEGFYGFDLANIILDLPAHDPATAWAATAVERLGFSFCAWLPEAMGSSDTLRLQRVSDRVIDFSTILCARPAGEAIRDFAIAEWDRISHLVAR